MKLYIELVTNMNDKVKISSEQKGSVTMVVTTPMDGGNGNHQVQTSVKLNKQGLKRLRDSLSVALSNFDSLI